MVMLTLPLEENLRRMVFHSLVGEVINSFLSLGFCINISLAAAFSSSQGYDVEVYHFVPMPVCSCDSSSYQFARIKRP